jgi:uncharacterized damage-inducible protein DinB
MSIGQSLLPEYDQEMAITRRVIERVPTEKGEWKPHQKSFPLGHLTQLVAIMPGWFTRVIREGRIDLASGPGYSFQSTESLLEQFDRHVREGREAIAGATDAELDETFQLTAGPQTLMSLPKGEVVRQTINHLIHHRGQLTVYLRLIDVPVPSIYGPTADEKWSGS